MKRNGKWTSLALSACLMATLLAGCGDSGNNAGGNSDGGSNNAASADSGGSGNSADKPPLKALLHYATTDYNASAPAKILEEKTGYKVQYDMLPQDKPEDKLNIIMASGEDYDFVSLGGVFKQLYYDYASRGALTDLTPLIDQYGPNIKAAVSEQSLDAVKVDGKIYAIPSKAISSTSWSVAIRTDWLEKLNLKMPTTLDELVQVLQAFKDKDPGGNGAQNIPLTAIGGAQLENIRGAFGLAQEWSDAGGKLVDMVENPAFKSYVSFVSGLYKQGLLDKEYVTTTQATMLEKFSSGRAGAMIALWSDFPTISTAIVKNSPGAKVAFTGALSGPDGKSGLALSGGFDLYTFVPKSAKHPEDAIKWINAKLDPDTFKQSYIGEEGVHYTLKDGAYYPILPKFSDDFGNANNLRTGVVESVVQDYWQARIRKDQMLYDGWHTINTIPDSQKIADPLVFAPFLPELAKNSATLTGMLNDYFTKSVVNGDVDATYDDFVKSWKAAGGDTVSKEVNDWYASAK